MSHSRLKIWPPILNSKSALMANKASWKLFKGLHWSNVFATPATWMVPEPQLWSKKASSTNIGFPSLPVCNPCQARTGQFSNKHNKCCDYQSSLLLHAVSHALKWYFLHRLTSFSEQKQFTMTWFAAQFDRTSEDKYLQLSCSIGCGLEQHLESSCRQLA